MRIGVFDSGIGGLTVLGSFLRHFPHHDYKYWGDTSHIPYGNKTRAELQNLASLNAQAIKKLNLDLLIVACTTMSSNAMELFEQILFPVPVIGTIHPVIDWLNKNPCSENLLLFATQRTIDSGFFVKTLREKLVQKTQILVQACPTLVPLIEQGETTPASVAPYVAPFLKTLPGIIILGCTHFPWARPHFESLLPHWTYLPVATAIVDAAIPFFIRTQVRPHSGSLEWLFTDPTRMSPFGHKMIAELQNIHTLSQKTHTKSSETSFFTRKAAPL
jgi:glutamate racemase